MGQGGGSVPAHPRAEMVIELGEMADRRPPDRNDEPVRATRRLALLLVAVLTAAGLVADAPGNPMRAVLVVSAEHGDFALIGDVLYILQGPYIPNQVVAYALRDGRRVWHRRSPTSTTYGQVLQMADRTVLGPNTCIAAQPMTTVAVDTSTGREVWHRAGTPEQVVAGTPGTDPRLILVGRPGATSDCGNEYLPDDRTPEYWDAVDARTGAVAWSIDVPASTRISLDSYGRSGARRGLFVARDGTITSRDLRTGAVTGRAALPDLALPARPTADSTTAVVPPSVTLVGNYALVTRNLEGAGIDGDSGAHPVEITAYDATTLAHRWTVRTDAGPTDPGPGSYYIGLSGCGPALCLYEPRRTVFLDPGDGHEWWRTGLSLLSVEGDRALFADPEATGGEIPYGGLTVRDTRTGRSRLDLPGWRTLSVDGPDGGPPVVGFTGGGRTWLATLDLARARVATVGSASGAYSACLSERGYLACRRIDGSVQVWRIRIA